MQVILLCLSFRNALVKLIINGIYNSTSHHIIGKSETLPLREVSPDNQFVNLTDFSVYSHFLLSLFLLIVTVKIYIDMDFKNTINIMGSEYFLKYLHKWHLYQLRT